MTKIPYINMSKSKSLSQNKESEDNAMNSELSEEYNKEHLKLVGSNTAFDQMAKSKHPIF